MQVKKKDQGPIRKGPWKAEEDEVLLSHVNKYGPRDWSSIRSKGLLQRTGKSCRLRWVNKLRPNLKNGCKFSPEEERVVIELQAQFGNKWAKIASYLPGRTDNDVKNFWSSRQKRLARILHSSSPSSKSHKNKNKVATLHINIPPLEAPKFSSSEEESSSKAHQPCSSSFTENSEVIKMVPLPDLMNFANPLSFDAVTSIKEEFTTPLESCMSTDMISQIGFPQGSPFSMESQDLFLARANESAGFADGIGVDPLEDYASELGIGTQIPFYGFPFNDSSGSCRIETRNPIGNPTNLDSVFGDFPDDMFDNLQPPPSPSSPEL
ncbi:transcription factor DUO1 [Prosopis cineraria]|uniref:transcription factor DUO1 n=1 Tax=Prosopis cineraria TaxID=364024 RepID=UPI00240FF7CF|nr:transcription factor DUO1 [Prosopis cineraria]